jgi:transcriptional regulator GlxA family with amidase domain
VTRNIAIVIFNGAEELDYVGPWEVFTMLKYAEEDSVNVFTVSQEGGVVTSAKGLRVLADHSFLNCPRPDILLVPGGMGTRIESENPVLLQFARTAAENAELVTSVCTGAFVLAAAGLLEGKRATTHWASIESLRNRTEGKTTVVDNERFVDEGRVITAAGVSAGIDMALHIVGRLWSPETARTVQKYMEYYPEPPYAERGPSLAGYEPSAPRRTPADTA